jgi:hypothetical protein
MLAFGLLMIYLIGEKADDWLAMFYRALILLAGELLLFLWFVRQSNRDDREHEPLMGEKCTGMTFCSFKRETEGFIHKVPVDVFQFTNRDYALRFAELNGGKVE